MIDDWSDVGTAAIAVVLALVWAVLWIFIIAWFLQLLWSLVMPQVFGLPTLTYGQSVALYGVSNLLFKNSTPNIQSTKKSD